MAKNVDQDNLELNLENQNDTDKARDVLRVLRYLIKRMKLENRKTWKIDDLISLLETMIIEIISGVTEEDKLRQIYATHGKTAFAAGTPRNKNPHPPKTNFNRWWDMGWYDAEREQKRTTGEAVGIHQGRVKETQPQQKTSRYYKVRVIKESMVNEWNEVFHQYSPEGQGTLFTDFAEAQVIADRLTTAREGIVSVIEVSGEGN